MAWTGLPQLLLIPFVPFLMKRFDSRLLAAGGLIVFATSCFLNLHLDANYAGPQLLTPDVTRAIGQASVMTPLSAIAMVGITPAEAGGASGLFNMLRNLGGAWLPAGLLIEPRARRRFVPRRATTSGSAHAACY
jgi:DHA2 family multidrug resistance protein